MRKTCIEKTAIVFGFALLLATLGEYQPRSASAAIGAKATEKADPGASAWGGGAAGAGAGVAARHGASLPGWDNLGKADAKLASRGKQAFSSLGCAGCHSIGGGRKVGPDLAGITARREPAWVSEMIEDPGAKLASDPYAKGLLATYLVKMAKTGATTDQRKALIEYLRSRDHAHPQISHLQSMQNMQNLQNRNAHEKGK